MKVISPVKITNRTEGNANSLLPMVGVILSGIKRNLEATFLYNQ